MICQICLKSSSTGISQRHRRGVAGRRWSKRAQATKRTFSPNIQIKTLKFENESIKVKICTKCIKRIKKFGAIKEFKNVAVA